MDAYRNENWELSEPVAGNLRKRLKIAVVSSQRGGDFLAGFGYVPTVAFIDEDILLEAETSEGTFLYPRELFSPEELQKEGYEVKQRKNKRLRIYPELLRGSDRISPRDDSQRRALEAIEDTSGHLVLSPGKGKTVLALKECAQRGHPFLVFVHNGGLYEQWKNKVHEHLGDEVRICDCRGPVKRWRDWDECPAAVATFQSFHNAYQKGALPKGFVDYYGSVVFDEAHHVKAKTFSEATWAFPGRRLALTATPLQSGMERIAYANIGPVLYEDLVSDLTPIFHYVPVQFGRSFKINKIPKQSAAYMMAKDRVFAPKNPEYKEYLKTVFTVVEDLLGREHTVLVSTPRVVVAEDFLERFGQEYPNMGIINGSVPFSERPEMLNRSQLTLVTDRIGEEGLDRPDISAVVCLFPFGSGQSGANKLSQSGGRALRKYTGKNRPEVYVVGPSIPALPYLKHNNERSAKSLGYEVSTVYVSPDAGASLPAGVGKSISDLVSGLKS